MKLKNTLKIKSLGNYLTLKNRLFKTWRKGLDSKKEPKRTQWRFLLKNKNHGEKRLRFFTLKQEPRTKLSLKNWYCLGIHGTPFTMPPLCLSHRFSQCSYFPVLPSQLHTLSVYNSWIRQISLQQGKYEILYFWPFMAKWTTCVFETTTI